MLNNNYRLYLLMFWNFASPSNIAHNIFSQNKCIWTQIHKKGKGFAEDLKKAGVSAVILFPFAGPETQTVWTKACFEAGLQVLTGGIMTHPKFLVSEGGYIADEAPERIFRLACELGVNHFVVPGNKLDWVRKLRNVLIEVLGEGNYALLAPGFIAQNGDISECGAVAGDNWHAIVGSGIYKAENIREAATMITKQIV